jgi:hypothetical protein
VRGVRGDGDDRELVQFARENRGEFVPSMLLSRESDDFDEELRRVRER